WSSDLPKLLTQIHTLLSKTGLCAFSIPLAGTFPELTQHAKNDFFSEAQIKHILQIKHYRLIQCLTKKIRLSFNSLLEALHSIKTTGTNYMPYRPITTLVGKSFLHSLFEQNAIIDGFHLTYHIGFFIADKNI